MMSVPIWSATICLIMFAVGFGLFVPVSGLIGGLADLVGVASGMVFLGSLDGE